MITTSTEQTSRCHLSLIRLGLILAVVALLLGACSDDDSADVEVDALDVADAYFEAFDERDADSVMALFTEDATFGASFDDGPIPRSEWEQRVVWAMAQGTVLTTPECSVRDVPTEGDITVTCVHGTRDAVVLALDSEQIPTTTTMVVAPEGISDFNEGFGNPDFADTGLPFTAWMRSNHPEEAETTGCCEGDTAEKSVARGELRAQYTQEWAAYLKANSCGYLDRC